MASKIRGSARKLLLHIRRQKYPYQNLIEIKIYRDSILHNLQSFQIQHSGVAVAPVLKSNAYGHGLREVGEILANETVPFLCVDSFFEALSLRNSGVSSPILIIGYTPVENVVRNPLRGISFCVIGLDNLREVSKHMQSPTRIHLEIDTGMHRHGILPEETKTAMEVLRSNKNLLLDGIYSHLADADTPGSAHTSAQIECWNELAEKFSSEFPNMRYTHCAATAGSAYLPKMAGNVMRLGIGLYGINTSTDALELRPVLEMQTRITSIRSLAPGEHVGYNATFETSMHTLVASIPAGYNEGVDRRLSNKGFVSTHGIQCPIIGRVSMNISSIDVSAVPNVKINDLVTILSRHSADRNSVEQTALYCGTIPYEILVHIPAHLRRVIV